MQMFVHVYSASRALLRGHGVCLPSRSSYRTAATACDMLLHYKHMYMYYSMYW
jgi:hypothetical protein